MLGPTGIFKTTYCSLKSIRIRDANLLRLGVSNLSSSTGPESIPAAGVLVFLPTGLPQAARNVSGVNGSSMNCCGNHHLSHHQISNWRQPHKLDDMALHSGSGPWDWKFGDGMNSGSMNCCSSKSNSYWCC